MGTCNSECSECSDDGFGGDDEPPSISKVKSVHVNAKYVYKHKKYKKYKRYKKYRKYRYKSKYRKVRGYSYTRIYRYDPNIGDCWSLSNLLYNKLKDDHKVRIIQYPTSLSPRHRTVQVMKNGEWVDYDYSNYNMIYHPTRHKSYTVIKCN